MKTAASSSRLSRVLFFIGLYLACLAVVFFVTPIWRLLEKLSYRVDDLLNVTGVAMADGEYDPAGLWVLFGVPLLVAIVIFLLCGKSKR
ncbi:hypothetical protein FJU30_12675 [Affinibrenneria salicis]|uniref:Uncharacterized protein n=1 Tax=Affinibrenneria salicis TaxID=2590031 RepID=A0A5J5G0S4_9GAMM|nr:hypothetical protein [Affinibrenneria salicis]KAA9000128.1 hypothetical protein FJU30_12675 [Affinibrenneria salicis]